MKILKEYRIKCRCDRCGRPMDTEVLLGGKFMSYGNRSFILCECCARSFQEWLCECIAKCEYNYEGR